MGQKNSMSAWRYKQEEQDTSTDALARKRHRHVDIVAMAEAEAACERWCTRLKPCDRRCAWDAEGYDWDYDVERTAAEWKALEAFVYFDQLTRAMRTATIDGKGRDTRNRIYPAPELIEIKSAEYRIRWEKAGDGGGKQ